MSSGMSWRDFLKVSASLSVLAGVGDLSAGDPTLRTGRLMWSNTNGHLS